MVKNTWLLVAAGVSFALFPVLRPWTDKTLVAAGMVEAFASPWWLVAHGLGAAGFALLAGALAFGPIGRRGPAWPAGVGAALVLPYFGLESLGLHGLASSAPVATVPALSDAMRFSPVAMATFGLGLLAWVVAGVALAVGHARAGRRGDPARWAGVPLGVGLVTYLPQFSLAPQGRIAHGVLMLAGAVVLAWLTRGEPSREVVSPQAVVEVGR